MKSATGKHHRIQLACAELERAIDNFEDDTETIKRAKKEDERIKEIKSRLLEIKKQLDELSN